MRQRGGSMSWGKRTSYISLTCCCVKLAGRLGPGKCPGAAAGCTEAIVFRVREGRSQSIEKDVLPRGPSIMLSAYLSSNALGLTKDFDTSKAR